MTGNNTLLSRAAGEIQSLDAHREYIYVIRTTGGHFQQTNERVAELDAVSKSLVNHLNTKLNEDQVREIRKLKGSLSQSQIAKQFGISQTFVGRIHNRKKWRFL